MNKAIKEAKKALRYGDVPVGAVVVWQDKIIAKAYNMRERKHDPTAHAEILALKKAAKVRGGWRLIDCTLYVTLEPCPMCAGAAINSRIPSIVFGAYDYKAGAFGSVYNLNEGLLNQECAQLLKDFFAKRRKK